MSDIERDGRTWPERWRAAAIQAKNDLRAIEEAFRIATPIGEDGPNPPLGPGCVFADWTSPANTMRWVEEMEAQEPHSEPDWELLEREVRVTLNALVYGVEDFDDETGHSFLRTTDPEHAASDIMDLVWSWLLPPAPAPSSHGQDVEALTHNLRLAEGWLLTGLWKDAQGHTSGEVAGWLDSAVHALRSRQEPEPVAVMEALEDRLGLHEGIEIVYVVDGYEATLTGHDGATSLRSARGDTLLAALTALASRVTVAITEHPHG